MKTLTVSKDEIETEAQDHAEETRYAVSHHGKELHPTPKKAKASKGSSAKNAPPEPWQVD